MRITSQANFTQPKNQPAFKSINLIQVSKKAFENSDDLRAVNDSFSKATSKVTGKINNKFTDFLVSLGLGSKLIKTIGFLEQPRYIEIMEELKKLGGGLSLNWLSQNTKTPIKEPLSKDFHSFYIYTKRNKDKVLVANSVSSQENLATINSLAFAKYMVNKSNSNCNDLTKKLVEENRLILGIIDTDLHYEPVHKFVINDLSELPDIFKKIDY